MIAIGRDAISQLDGMKKVEGKEGGHKYAVHCRKLFAVLSQFIFRCKLL